MEVGVSCGLPAWWTFQWLPACGEQSTKLLEMAEQNYATFKANPSWFFGVLWPKQSSHPCCSTVSNACAQQAAPSSAAAFTSQSVLGWSQCPLGQALIILGWVGAGEDMGRDTRVPVPPLALSLQFFLLFFFREGSCRGRLHRHTKPCRTVNEYQIL